MTPSVSVEFDTFDNSGMTNLGDIAADHVDVIYNGANIFNAIGPFPATPITDLQPDGTLNVIDIEDDVWHDVVIEYATCDSFNTQCLTVIFDGDTIVDSFCDNIIDSVFNGESDNIILGFTSATAASTNSHVSRLDAINNDFGPRANVNANVNISQADNVGYPSFAKCSNQEANFSSGFAGGLDTYAVYLCATPVLTENNPNLVVRNAIGEAVLSDTYVQAISSFEVNDIMLFNEVKVALNSLSEKTSVDQLYNEIISNNALNDNQKDWLTYIYQNVTMDYIGAENTLLNIPTENTDEEAFKNIEYVNLSLDRSSRSLFELQDDEIVSLGSIDGKYASLAQDMIHFSQGKRYYEFDGLPLSQPLTDTKVTTIDFSADKLEIYPNPASNNVTIQFVVEEGSDNELQIFNSMRQKVYSEKLTVMTNEVMVDVPQLTSGIYLVSISNENGVIKSNKLIKK